jgi:hypothetical protein
VVLVTVTWLGGSIEQSLDKRMDAVAASNHTFHILDWGKIEYENPHWLFDDAVHPAVQGQRKLASLERLALKDDCRR